RRLALPGRRLSRDRRTRPALLAVVPSMTHSAVARKARAGSMPLCCRQLPIEPARPCLARARQDNRIGRLRQ
ncbi:TPA: hypothetical protein ACWMAU_006293, partial [Pseudomonas aeruginosa]